jgi:hypothetical protein
VARAGNLGLDSLGPLSHQRGGDRQATLQMSQRFIPGNIPHPTKDLEDMHKLHAVFRPIGELDHQL